MRFPYERWLAHLLEFRDFTKEEVIELCENHGLVVPDVEDLASIARRTRASKPANCRKRSKNYLAWVREAGYWELYAGTRTMRIVTATVFNDYRLRQTIDYLLFANTEPYEVVVWIEDVLGVELTTDVVELYSKCFCDIRSMPPAQVIEFCKRMSKTEGFTLIDTYQLRSAEFALHKLGHRVEMPRDEVFKMMFQESAVRFAGTSLLPNNHFTAQTAKSWAEVAMLADNKMGGEEDAKDQILQSLQDLRIELGAKKVTTVEDLRAERHAARKISE